jgi:hypothetical protein
MGVAILEPKVCVGQTPSLEPEERHISSAFVRRGFNHLSRIIEIESDDVVSAKEGKLHAS